MNIKSTFALAVTWLVMPLTPTFAQSTWQTVDALTPALGMYVLADSNGNFISTANDKSTTNRMSDVSVSTDQGLTWQTVGQIPDYLARLAQGPDGTVYAMAQAIVN